MEVFYVYVDYSCRMIGFFLQNKGGGPIRAVQCLGFDLDEVWQVESIGFKGPETEKQMLISCLVPFLQPLEFDPSRSLTVFDRKMVFNFFLHEADEILKPIFQVISRTHSITFLENFINIGQLESTEKNSNVSRYLKKRHLKIMKNFNYLPYFHHLQVLLHHHFLQAYSLTICQQNIKKSGSWYLALIVKKNFFLLCDTNFTINK